MPKASRKFPSQSQDPRGCNGTAAAEDGPRTIAHAALVIEPDTVVLQITNAIPIEVGQTVPATNTEGIQLIAFAITGSRRKRATPTIKDGPGTIADSTLIIRPNTTVNVVALAITVHISKAVAIADPQSIDNADTGVHIVTDSVPVDVQGTGG